jgi:hypothetical protein
MGNFRSLLILGAAAVQAASSPWEDFQQRHRGLDPSQARWTLAVRPGDFNPNDLLQDQLFQRLIVSGDLSMEALSGPEAADCWLRQGWSGPAWVLLTPVGELARSGSGQPRGEPLADAMRAAGSGPSWETRAAFLREHPDQGEALLAEVQFQFRLMRSRLLALDRQGRVRVPAWHGERPRAAALARVSLEDTPENRTLAEELCGDGAKALARLLAVPGWKGVAGTLAAQLNLLDVSRSAAMRAVFGPAAARAETLLEQDPFDVDLAYFWIEARDAAGLAPAAPGGQFSPTPGRVWPTPTMVNRILEPYRRRQDWEGALKCLAGLTTAGHPEPLTRRGWDEHCRLQCTLLVQKAVALGQLGSWDLAGSALEDGRRWGGAQGVREALLFQGSAWAGADPEPGGWRAFLAQALGNGGEPPALPALDPPLRLVVMGTSPWLAQWSRLRLATELLPWSPGELRWEAVPQAPQEALRQRYGWAPGPRWVLYRGEEFRATGSSSPEPRALAVILEGEGPTLLQRLQRLADAQPEQVGVRRARFTQLLARMPEPRLEPTLARDAAVARIALDFGPDAPWKPDPDLWAAAAQEALPRIEEELRSWPGRTSLWAAWIGWARFHPRQPSVLAMAQSLPYWSPRSDWRAGLPFQVQRAVAGELRRQGSFDLMRTWFRAAWDALDQRPLASLRPGERSWVLERRREEDTAVFQPLREALRALRCGQEQMEVERAFGAMIGQDMGRRP